LHRSASRDLIHHGKKQGALVVIQVGQIGPTGSASLKGTGEVAAARERLARAVDSGDRHAMFELAENLLRCEPAAPHIGVRLLRVAASQGESRASHLCAVIAAQDTQAEHNWDIALDYLALAAEQGSEVSRRELQILAGMV
jgi:hypothetical protein